MIPYYLKEHLTDVTEKKDSTMGILTSSAGNTDLKIYQYGDTMKINGTPYIVQGELPMLIVAKDPATNEEFTVFDGMKHGYDAMFCDAPDDSATRELKLYEYYSGKIQIGFSYSIDYEDEKEDYNFNEHGEIKLTYGDMDWEQAKSIGFDWISLAFADHKKEFVELELA